MSRNLRVDCASVRTRTLARSQIMSSDEESLSGSDTEVVNPFSVTQRDVEMRKNSVYRLLVTQAVMQVSLECARFPSAAFWPVDVHQMLMQRRRSWTSTVIIWGFCSNWDVTPDQIRFILRGGNEGAGLMSELALEAAEEMYLRGLRKLREAVPVD